MNEVVFWVAPAAALFALAFAGYFFQDMKRQDQGTEVMQRIGQHVREGAMAYLRQQYRIMLVVFIGLASVFAVLAYGFGVQNPWLPVTFVCGGFFSALAGFFGMQTATLASTRTAAAARTSLQQSLRIAFRSGAVIGLIVVGLGLGNVVLWFLLVNWATPESVDGTPYGAGDHHRADIQYGRVATGLVRPCRRRYLHQGGGCGRRPGG